MTEAVTHHATGRLKSEISSLESGGGEAALCPCCGASVNPMSVNIDASRGLVVHRGSVVRLAAGTEFSYFRALYDAYPRVLSRDELFDAIYGERPESDQPDIKVVDVMVCKIRKRLDPIGIVIKTSWGVGYSIDFTDPETAQHVRAEGMAKRLRRSTWLAETDVEVRDLFERGFALSAIAQRLGTTYTATERAIKRLGLRR